MQSDTKAIDLKSMLDKDGTRSKAGGNPLNTDIDAIAPMG